MIILMINKTMEHGTNSGNFKCRKGHFVELDNSTNCICSPLSVETLLGLVALGSSNDTRAELLRALNIPNEDAVIVHYDTSELRSTFKTLTETLDFSPKNSLLSLITSKFKSNSSNKGDAILKIANKIYVKQAGTLKPELKKDAVNVFKSSLEQIDFKKSTDAANTINCWVSNQTNNLIKDIISPGMLDENTALVLVNAIYFHGYWEIPFSMYNTGHRDFHVNNTKKLSIDMMSMEGQDFGYTHSPALKAKILQMFYKGGEASMVMVLPNNIEGLRNVMKRLTAGYNLKEDIKSLEKTRIKVVIPKFKVETQIDLKKVLPKMGIPSIFDKSKSDIGMLTSNEPLYVSEAIQKAYIVVDERGTEATAATLFSYDKECKLALHGRDFQSRPPLPLPAHGSRNPNILWNIPWQLRFKADYMKNL